MITTPLRIAFLVFTICFHQAWADGISKFSWTTPTECGQLTVTWTGGTGPFSLLVTSSFSAPRNYSIPDAQFDKNSKTGSFSTTMLLGSQTQFIMTLSDATGFGAGGTTGQLFVGAAQDGNTCDKSIPTMPFSFDVPLSLQTCHDYSFTNYGNAKQPITIFGLIPGGTPFILNPPTSSSSYIWKANVAVGTTVVFVLQDSRPSFGGSTSFLGVGDSNDISCVNSTSPASTSGSNPSPTGSSSSYSPSSTSTNPPTKGKSNAAAIGGGVGGGIVFLIVIISLLLFFMKKRREEQRRAGGTSGFEEGAFQGGKKNNKGRRMRSIDLLPEDRDNAAHFPLNGDAGNSSSHLPNDYEPVPYVIPPPSAVTAPLSEYNQTTAWSNAASTGPYRDDDDLEPWEMGPPGSRTRTTSQHSRSNAPLTKAQMVAQQQQQQGGSSGAASNAPARFVLHTDAGSVMGTDDGEDEEDEVVELPPQYTSLGTLIPQRKPSRRTSQRRAAEAAEGSSTDGAATSSTSAGPSAAPTAEST